MSDLLFDEKSNLTYNELKKVKCKTPACGLFEQG